MITSLPAKRISAIWQWKTFVRVFFPQYGGESQLASKNYATVTLCISDSWSCIYQAELTGTVRHAWGVTTGKVSECFIAKCWIYVLQGLPLVLRRCWLGGRKIIRPVKTEWWGAGVVICLERGADLHMVQLMPLPLTVSCFSKIQIGFTFLVPAHPGSPGQRAVKRLCVCAEYVSCRHRDK